MEGEVVGLTDVEVKLLHNCHTKCKHFNVHINTTIYLFEIFFQKRKKALISYKHIDGEPLEFDEIEKDLPAYYKKALSDSKWTFITQEVQFYILISSLFVWFCFPTPPPLFFFFFPFFLLLHS